MSALAHVLITLDADAQMGRVPGLRARVQQHLLGILEAAIEIKKLHADWYPDGDAPLLTRVDQFEISYSLDVSSTSVTVLAAAALESVSSEERDDAAMIPFALIPFARQPASAGPAENDLSSDSGQSRIAR